MEVSFFDVVIALAALLYVLYLYGVWNYGRFNNTKVPFLKPLPIVGNSVKLIFRLEDVVVNTGKSYISFPEHRFTGLFQMRTPTIMIRDPELIRQVGVKDFDHFADHQSIVSDKLDPLLSYNLFFLKGQKWRDMRTTLSPAFTGSKMRNMYSLVSDCAQQMAAYLKRETHEKGLQILDIKDLFTRYTNDVIASAAFGLQVNSLEDHENIFYKMGKRVSRFDGILISLKLFGFILAPKLMEILRFRLLEDECTQFFRRLVHETIRRREQEGIVRPDMIHLLMQARQGTLQHDSKQQQDAGFATVIESDLGMKQTQKNVWTDDDLTAQALIFFLAGFETTSTALCFTVHELAVNPEVQKRLQAEIDEVSENLEENQSPNYEGINLLKYMDMVISEALRMWPPLPFLDRVCVKPYVLEDYEGHKYQLDVGELIVFPTYNLHHDKKYYDNPDKFDPERFSDENKKNIKPFTYLPFGVGPRNCIGSRFALMEVKAILFNILRYFDIVPCAKTQNPLKLTKSSFNVAAEKGFWVSFAPRENK